MSQSQRSTQRSTRRRVRGKAAATPRRQNTQNVVAEQTIDDIVTSTYSGALTYDVVQQYGIDARFTQDSRVEVACSSWDQYTAFSVFREAYGHQVLVTWQTMPVRRVHILLVLALVACATPLFLIFGLPFLATLTFFIIASMVALGAVLVDAKLSTTASVRLDATPGKQVILLDEAVWEKLKLELVAYMEAMPDMQPVWGWMTRQSYNVRVGISEIDNVCGIRKVSASTMPLMLHAVLRGIAEEVDARVRDVATQYAQQPTLARIRGRGSRKCGCIACATMHVLGDTSQQLGIDYVQARMDAAASHEPVTTPAGYTYDVADCTYINVPDKDVGAMVNDVVAHRKATQKQRDAQRSTQARQRNAERAEHARRKRAAKEYVATVQQEAHRRR